MRANKGEQPPVGVLRIMAAAGNPLDAYFYARRRQPASAKLFLRVAFSCLANRQIGRGGLPLSEVVDCVTAARLSSFWWRLLVKEVRWDV